MGHQIQEFKKSECSSKNLKVIIGPSSSSILRMQKEIHAKETEYCPVMSRVFEYVHEWHSIV